jgi:hypothetical protein
VKPLPEIVVYSRRGCHLCELLLEELEPLVRARAALTVRDVDDQPEWRKVFGERVPVVCGGAEEICHYHLDHTAVYEFLEASDRAMTGA